MYNNPYYYNYSPYNQLYMSNQIPPFKPKGNLTSFVSKIKWGTILNNTQKTLNVINQAIPIYYQIKPIASNIRSLGKIIGAFKDENDNENKTSQNINSINQNTNQSNIKEENSNLPTFFIN